MGLHIFVAKPVAVATPLVTLTGPPVLLFARFLPVLAFLVSVFSFLHTFVCAADRIASSVRFTALELPTPFVPTVVVELGTVGEAMVAVLAPPVLDTVVVAVASPLVIVTAPPVLELASFLPVFADASSVLVKSLELSWVEKTVAVALTVTLFVELSPLVVIVTSTNANTHGATRDPNKLAVTNPAPRRDIYFFIVFTSFRQK